LDSVLQVIVANAIVVIGGLVTVSVRMTWKAAEIRAEILRAVEAHVKDDTTEFAEVRNEIDSTARAFGETIAALRQRIGDVELNSANTYVRRDGFYKSIEQVTMSISSLRVEIREDLRRLEGKIDTKS